MKLALFDLDHTLLSADSSERWGCFLADQGLIDQQHFMQGLQGFEQQYQQGDLDIVQCLSYAVQHTLLPFSAQKLHSLFPQFIQDYILPTVTKAAWDVLAEHRAQDHQLVIATGCFEPLAAPIARVLGVPHLIASQVAYDTQGNMTAAINGTACYQQGKIQCVGQWIAKLPHTVRETWFYSDSHNDIPLLEWVDHAIVVNPDPKLAAYAQSRSWQRRDLY